MAAGTVTVHGYPSAGSYIRYGTCTAFNDGDTCDTGLVKADGFTGTTNQNDCVISKTSQSAGVVTVAAKTAGAAAVNISFDWIAWQLPSSG